ncbi:MAG: hypothetical protein ACPGYX_02500 [Oceanobacter sp.]
MVVGRVFGKISKSLLTASALALMLSSGSKVAWAHAGHDEQLKILIAERQVDIQVSVDADLLLDFDSNRNGILEAGEFRRQSSRIQDWIDHRLRLVQGSGDIIPASFADMPITGFHAMKEDEPIEKLRILRRYNLQSSGGSLRLAYELFAPGQTDQDYLMLWKQGQIARGHLTAEGRKLLTLSI